MALSLTGGDADDRGPLGCVTRFILAGEARDQAAATAELHPDCVEGVSVRAESPPGVIGITLDEPQPVDDNVQVAARMSGEDGTEQRFVFVVRPVDGRWGLDLNASMAATFGGDPIEMMGDALRQAIEPLGDALNAIGDGISTAMGGGSSDGSGDGPAARRIAADDALPPSDAVVPTELTAHLTDLELRRRIQRSAPAEEFAPSTELSVRLVLDLDPAWTANACRGVTVTTATALKGEDLVPVDANPDLGAESYASWERERHEVYARFALASPQKPFTGLKALAGTVRLDLVGGDLLEIALGPVGDLLGRPIALAAFGIEVQLDRDESGSLVLKSPSGWTDRLSEIRPTDPNGDPLNDSWSSSGDGETDTRTYGSEIPDDASLLFRFWSQRVVAEVAFSVADLPVKLD